MTTKLLAMELHTSVEDVTRQMEYLEHMGVIKRVVFTSKGCSGCSGCSTGDGSEGHTCKGCLPEEGVKNMGQMWEVV